MTSVTLFLCLFIAFVAGQLPNPIVRVPNGVLQGSWKVTPKGRSYASFQGIPYARPPVGKYRFREPQQMKPWAGTWDATRPLTVCLQYDPFAKSVLGSENCLFLNVYTPNINAGGTLPVLVFIHGGAFMYGSGFHYDPSAIVDRDMVVVTLNYRLGPLGFLSTGDEAAPGNAGLKDQAFALRWVQNNIMMFGGNPASVTLTGCSAGGASVHYHYLSPMSKGLFARGIAWSGSAFASWTHAVKPAQKARALAASVGCPTATSREMVDCLKYRPAEVVVNAQIDMFLNRKPGSGSNLTCKTSLQTPEQDWKVHMFTTFTPTTEGYGAREPFLTQYPYHAAQAGTMHKVPLITSITSEEGLYPAASYVSDLTILPELESRWEQLASNIFEYNDTLPVSLRPSVAAKIKQHYLGGKPVSKDTFPQLVQALADRLFGADVGRLAQLHALRSGQPVFVYRFSHRGSTSLSDFTTGTKTNYGVSHADDLFHFMKFQYLDFNTPEDKKMADVFLDMIYSYASTGVPKVPIAGTQWLPVTPGAPELNYLEISSPSRAEMNSSMDFGQKSFWDSLGFIENEKYQMYIKDEL